MNEPSEHPDDSALKKAGGDFLAGLVIFLISLYVLFDAYRMPFYGDSGALGSPGLTPGLIASCMLVLSGVLMWRSRVFRLPNLLSAPDQRARRVLTVLGLVLAYVVLMPVIGYAPATFLLLAAFQIIFVRKRDLRFIILWGVGLSAVLTAILWYVFAEIFLIPLP
ncbi:MAG: tripartite tricarboxylate transporter TctB family protein [Pseudomonadota bacterium]